MRGRPPVVTESGCPSQVVYPTCIRKWSLDRGCVPGFRGCMVVSAWAKTDPARRTKQIARENFRIVNIKVRQM